MARRDFVLVCSSDLAAESRQVLIGQGFPQPFWRTGLVWDAWEAAVQCSGAVQPSWPICSVDCRDQSCTVGSRVVLQTVPPRFWLSQVPSVLSDALVGRCHLEVLLGREGVRCALHKQAWKFVER